MTDSVDTANTASSSASASSSTSSDLYHLVYSKSRVTLHPTPYSKDNIPGYLCLLRRSKTSSHASTSTNTGISTSTSPQLEPLISWLPEDLIKDRSETAKFVDVELREAEGADQRGEEEEETLVRDANGNLIRIKEVVDHQSILIQPPPFPGTTSTSPASYAFAHPLTQVYSLHLTPPNISNWHGSLTVSFQGGETLPPLYFHDDESRRTILGMIRAGKKPSTSTTTESSSSPSSSGESSATAGTGNAASMDSSPTATTTYPPPSHPPPPIWGGDELLQHLRKYAFVHRSVHDHNIFLLNPSPSDLEIHSTPIFADDALDPQQHQTHSEPSFPDDPFAPTYPMRFKTNGATAESLSSWAKTTRMSLLTSFSHVTRSARDASRQILSHPAGRPYTSRLPAAVQSFAHAGPLGPFAPVTPDEDPTKISQRAGVAEYDSARVYLAKWAKLVAEEGERNRKREEARRGADGGQDSDETGPTQEHGGLGAFELLNFNGSEDDASPPSTMRNFDPIHLDEWQSWFDASTGGKPNITLSTMKQRVWARGLAPSTRQAAWPFLLGVLPWDDSMDAQREAVWAEHDKTYEAVERLCDPETSSIWERDDVVEQRHRIRVDCLRIDRKLPLFSDQRGGGDNSEGGKINTTTDHISSLAKILLAFTLCDTYGCSPSSLSSSSHLSSKLITDSELGGYVQGMSDLCAPLYVLNDGHPSRTLASFTSFMRRVRTNFYSNQSGMKSQLLHLQTLLHLIDAPLFTHLDRTDSLNLFFVFRWLLVRFKREFPSYEQVCRLWEAFLAAETHLTEHMHIFVALYVLLDHRTQTMEFLTCFDEVLQYFQGLGGTLDVEECLRGAERVVRVLKRWVQQQEERKGEKEGREGDTVWQTVRELVL